jgi:hypothetical protein
MRRTALFALLLSVSACSSAPTEPDEIVPTETTADAVRVTSTPGVAVWTKLWRWETNTQPTIPGDVASNEGGTTFIVRGKAGQAYPAYLMQYLDVTRYAADGSMGFRTELDTVNIEPDSLHIAAGGTRVAVGANRRIDAAEHGLVYVLTSGGSAVTTVQIDASQAVVSDVAVDGNGNTFVAGHGYGAITIDGAPMGGAQGENNAFLMKLDPSGIGCSSTRTPARRSSPSRRTAPATSTSAPRARCSRAPSAIRRSTSSGPTVRATPARSSS